MNYFSYDEFDSPDAPGSGLKYMDKSFCRMLDEARGYANIPFIINSGYRTVEHNIKVGGVKNSAHTIGKAADIRCTNTAEALRIIWACSQAGFSRIGLAKGFVHVDSDNTKPTPAFWEYN
jgi:uncharacterized protein YcbK (DUF882 family)